MRFVVATHGHCFDGLASAVLFTALSKQLYSEAAFEYRACGYGVNQLHAEPGLFTGDENAILDYRFVPCTALTWYFDHHKTAFTDAEAQSYFEDARKTRRFYFDPDATSCTRFIADVAERDFGFRADRLDDLVKWADTIDSARFQNAADAVDQNNPVLRLAAVVEHYADDRFLKRFVPRLLSTPLSDLAESPDVARKYAPLGRRQRRFAERVREKAEQRGRVVFVDLTDAVTNTLGKFVTYSLFPDSVYSVVVGLLTSGIKISVGYNPWCGKPCDRDIGSLCARYGGGGHAVVGGISLAREALERARQVAAAVAEQLA